LALCMAGLLVAWGAVALALDTDWQEPSQNTGDFRKGSAAYHDDNKCAEAENGETHTYWGYEFNLGPEVQITGIEVRLDAWRDPKAEESVFHVELSWDGGVNWTSTGHNTGPLTTTEATYVLGGPTDTWGRMWTVSELAYASFRLRITAMSTRLKKRAALLDWVSVKVYYAAQQLTLSTTVIDFGYLTLGDYDAGYKELASAQTLYVTSGTSWVVTVKALNATWTYTGEEPDPFKACTDLKWRSTSSDPAVTVTNDVYIGMTTTDAQVAAGNAGTSIEIWMSFRLLLSYERDAPGEYSLRFVYTLTNP